MKYCEAIYSTKRRQTREVKVGNIHLGGNNPVRIQSMTTSNTRDAEATIEQIMRLADSGCEIARVTVQGMKEAETCEHIKNGLLKRGYAIPLVADIHFFPPAAMKAVEFVEKVRINPGNYVDKRASFKIIEYDDLSYAKELEKIEEKFTPLIEKCKKFKRAMRIGTNHGSLSDRIMNRYGDTPQGMLESALEFARLCRKNDFHDFVFSMKASNPQVMIQAYRLLVAEMYALDWDYPLHLGVTEAGEGEDGRIKSAMGIGSLLLDGIGDTIRVSLTEDPWHEIDSCRRLLHLSHSYENQGVPAFEEQYRNVKELNRRDVVFPKNIALHRDGSVYLSMSPDHLRLADVYAHLGCEGSGGQPKLKISSADGIVLKEPAEADNTKVLHELRTLGMEVLSELVTLKEAEQKKRRGKFALQIAGEPSFPVYISNESEEEWSLLEAIKPSLILFGPSQNRLHSTRKFFEFLRAKNIQAPVILNFAYSCSKEDLVIHAAAEYGALFCDGLGEGIWIEGPYEVDFLRNLSFNILQAARLRTSKTDFISCPSCGRTLFDLQEVSKRIRERTAHLPGVKIAIMGCIVNGPGEMADAHFGYVGSKPGMIDLYVGKACVEKDINFDEADDRLVELIKKHGRWIEKEEVNEKSFSI